MTHAELVKRAERWLSQSMGCGFVLTELSSLAREIPDAIGFKKSWSYLIECKASRSDFLADRHKGFRKAHEQGMGNYRFYMTPPGLIGVDELPDQWGLLEVHKTVVRTVRKATGFLSYKVAFNDRRVLCSALRRVQIRGDLQKIYTLQGEEA